MFWGESCWCNFCGLMVCLVLVDFEGCFVLFVDDVMMSGLMVNEVVWVCCVGGVRIICFVVVVRGFG